MRDAASTASHDELRPRDYRLLLACCGILYLLALGPRRVLSGHAAVVPQTAREMLASRDWLIFYSFAINPEADIFLCLIVTAVMASFVRLEFGRQTAVDRSSGAAEPSGSLRRLLSAQWC